MIEDRQTRLIIDIETRLRWLYGIIIDEGDMDDLMEKVVAYVNAAYGQGYTDAVGEIKKYGYPLLPEDTGLSL